MSFSSKHLTQGEQVELSLRTHFKKIVGSILLLIAMIAVVIAAYYWLNTDYMWAFWVILALALIITVIWVVIPIMKWRATQYIITNRRLITRTGIMSKAGRDIPLYRINDVSYEKGVLDRLLGCGTLIISDASDQPPLKLDDVPHVEQTQVRLDELLFAHDNIGSERGGYSEPVSPRPGNDAPRRAQQQAPYDQQSDQGYDRQGYDGQGYDGQRGQEYNQGGRGFEQGGQGYGRSGQDYNQDGRGYDRQGSPEYNQGYEEGYEQGRTRPIDPQQGERY